jgi:ketosteroid isomerase-like protein
MSDNKQLIEKFYAAFQKRDGKTMTECYHPEASFSDAVFTSLKGDDIGRMWRMLCQNGKDLVVEPSNIKADGDKGSAHWDAYYSFSATGRKVHNSIDATFEFKDGLIYVHHDQFDFHRWAGQALGPMGKLLGWTPFLQNKVRKMAAGGLAKFTG